MGRQEYPKDVLASKRLMTDFDPDVATGTKRTHEQVQLADVAFVESGGWEFPICYCCGKKCNKYGWRRFPSSSQKMKDKTANLVKAGHFSPKKKNMGKDSDDASTVTSPPTNMADKKGTTFTIVEEESKDEDLPTFEDYLQREGMISINVKNDISGFTGVQGRGGSNPDNRKQVVKTVPPKKLVSFKATASPPAESHVPGKAVTIKNAKPAWINNLIKKDNPKIKTSRRRQKKSLYR